MIQTGTVNDAICNNPELLWDDLGLEGEIYNEHANISCPVHNSSKRQSLSIYFNDYGQTRGRWKCHTRSCQKVFRNSVIGFVRGILSNRHCNWAKPGDKVYGWKATLDYLKGLYGIDGASIIDPGEVERKKFIRNCHCVEEPLKDKVRICTKEKYLKAFTSPSTYLQSRGFSEELLNEYDIRHYTGSDYVYQRRSIIPIYDDENRWLIGYTGRSEDNRTPKWMDSNMFPKSTSLFNYDNAIESIKKSRCVVITEGPLDVLKLRQAGIDNCVALWGAAGWNDYKKYLLDKLGVMKLVLVLDNDEAGRDGTERIHLTYIISSIR